MERLEILTPEQDEKARKILSCITIDPYQYVGLQLNLLSCDDLKLLNQLLNADLSNLQEKVLAYKRGVSRT